MARDIAFLIRFLGEQTDVTTIARVDEYHLEAYLAELDRRSYSGQAQAAQGLVDQVLLRLPARERSSSPRTRRWACDRPSGSIGSHGC